MYTGHKSVYPRLVRRLLLRVLDVALVTAAVGLSGVGYSTLTSASTSALHASGSPGPLALTPVTTHVVGNPVLPPTVPSANASQQLNTTDCPSLTSPVAAEPPACTQDLLAFINAQRVTQEKLAPIVLPSNWTELTPQEQLFVATNLERTSRGLVPLFGMVASLSQLAQTAADHGVDPLYTGTSYSGVEASGEPVGLAAMFDWMYVDGCGVGPGGGPPSDNYDCAANTPWTQWPSWGHRTAEMFAGPCPCAMGAGYAPPTGSPSQDTGTAQGATYTELLVSMPSGAQASFAWEQELQFLPTCERSADNCT